MPAIKHFLTIHKPPAVVFRAVTEQDALASWWTPQTIAAPEVGAVLEFRFGDRYHNKMRVTALQPDARVEWECFYGDPEWVGTGFTFALEAGDEGETILRFTHGDWRDETDFFASCNYHWGYYMRSLKLYCEIGCGTPFRPEEE